MTDRLKYYGAGILACMIWGFFSIPLRMLQGYESTEILIYRIFTSLFICILISAAFRKKVIREDINFLRSQPQAARSSLISLLLISSIFITANWFSFIYAINNISVQSGAFAYMVCPIITAMMAYLILKEELSPVKWIAILICIASVVILSFNHLRDVIFSVIIALLYTVYLLMQKRITGLNKFNILLVQLFVSTLIILPFYFSSGMVVPSDLKFWLLIIIISVFFTIIPLFLSLYALIGMPSSTMGIIIYMNPVVAFMVAVFYFNEQVSGIQIAAYALLIFAVILFNRDVIRKYLVS